MEVKKSKWDRLFWTWKPASEREAGDSVVRNLLLHWFPAKVTKESLSFRYSFWLGTVSALLFGILAVTGVVLMFLYVPSVERAYPSVKDLEFTVSFGGFIRAVHRISAHLMVAVVFLHLVRVFWTGAYKNGTATNQNRPFNWILGLALLLITFLLSFTGYLLPWDQLAYWAITVGTNIASAAPLVGDKIRFLFLGGNEIEQNTLLRFYVLHCFFLPMMVLFLFSWHMWRVRKDGGLACVDQLALKQKSENTAPVKSKTYSLLGITRGRTVHVETALVDEDEHTVPSSPNLTRRLLAVMLVTLTVVALLAVFVRAPLEEPANPWSRQIRRKRRGTSSGCRNWSPIPPSTSAVLLSTARCWAASWCRVCSFCCWARGRTWTRVRSTASASGLPRNAGGRTWSFWSW